VDDDPFMRELLGMTLKTWGCQWVEAENGRAALEELEAQSIDIVISDQQMPVMTGTEFIAELHHRYKNCSPPVILMSGDHQPQLQNRARELGAEAFFGKPYHMQALIDVLELIMDNRRPHAFVN
jgi:CheY-like chemotaxis protein